MKKKIKIQIWSLITGLTFTIFSLSAYSQEMVKMCNLSAEELKTKFENLSGRADIKVLKTELKGKGFDKLSAGEATYGFTGTFKDSSGKSLAVEFYAFDYYNKTTNQMGSLIWRNDGKSVYKAYLTFPAGEKDFARAMDESQEMYVDANNKVQKAHSFGKCWKNCVFKHCKSWCIGSIAICAAATATLAIASAGPTAGIGVGASVAIFAGCAGISCGLCFGVCAVGCF